MSLSLVRDRAGTGRNAAAGSRTSAAPEPPDDRRPAAGERSNAGSVLWRDEVTSPRIAVACVAALGVVAILSLLRVFTSPIYLAWALPAAAVGATFAFTYGRRSLAMAFAMMTAVAALTLPSLFAKELTYLLLPTRAALRLVRTLLVSGLSAIMNEQAPVPADSRYLVALWLACLAGGFLAASWVVVGRPLGAALTALGLLVYAGNVGEGSGRNWFGFAAAVLLGAFLLLDGRHRISVWSRPPRRVPTRLGTPTLAVACLLGLIGPLVLGSSTPLLELSGALRPRIVIIKPLSDVKRQLDVNPPVEVMRVRASTSAYWRLTALDQYTGTEWLLEAHPEGVREGRVPDSDPPTRGEIVRQEYSITSLLAPWLPAAYAAQRVDSPLPFDADHETSTLLLRDETLPGLRYSVSSQLPASSQPSSAAEPVGKPDPDAQYWAELARPMIGRARTPYDQALALQNAFRRSFRYDEKVAGGHDQERLKRFMADRTGYCEQFAAVMTLMLRGLGTPARVGVGFLPGRKVGDDYVVTTKDAHAWVEARLPSGWVQFDPTPGRGAAPAVQEQPAQSTGAETPPPPPPAAQATPEPEEQGSASQPGERASFPTRGVLLTLAAAIVIGAVPGLKRLRRRLRRSADPVRSVLGAYAELVDGVADFGERPRASQTQWELWRRAFAGGAAAGGEAASRVVRAAAGAIYGPDGPASEEADMAWSDLRAALRGLSSSRTWPRRLRAWFDPRTLTSRG